MTAETYNYIQKTAEIAINYCGFVPKTLDEIKKCLEMLHGELEEVEMMDVTVDGMVAKTPDDGFVVRLPKRMDDDRKLFFIAKGIGHAFMHLNYDVAQKNANWLFMQEHFFYTLPAEAHDQAHEFAHAFLKDGKSKYKVPEARKEHA